MKAVIIALVLVAGVLSNELNQDALQTLWNSWKQQYNKDYQDEAVEAMRYATFVDNYKFVVEWNAAGNTATLALNKFADLNTEEFGALYTGAKIAPPSVVEANMIDLSEVNAPDSWDWRSQGAVTPIKNQGQCGSCWAFSTVAATEGLYKINGNSLTSFSEQQIVDCDNTCDGCDGGWPYKAFAYVAANGLELESEYPYTAQDGKCKYSKSQATTTGVSGYSFVTPRSQTALTNSVYQQPTSIIVEADQQSFQMYSSGVITTGCGVNLDHAITAVGYGTESGEPAWIVKNSWGTDWGVAGYVYISQSTQYNSGLGACGIYSQPQVPKGLKTSN